MSRFKWDKTKETAAALLAVGELTYQEIAAQCGVTSRSIINWLGEEQFKARVDSNVEEIRKKVLSHGIADLVQRVKRLDKRWNAIDRLIAARGMSLRDVPGGETGLLCKEQKVLGGGEFSEVVDVYKVDAALLKEERELAKQASIELGQWQEKTAIMTDAPDRVILDI